MPKIITAELASRYSPFAFRYSPEPNPVTVRRRAKGEEQISRLEAIPATLFDFWYSGIIRPVGTRIRASWCVWWPFYTRTWLSVVSCQFAEKLRFAVRHSPFAIRSSLFVLRHSLFAGYLPDSTLANSEKPRANSER